MKFNRVGAAVLLAAATFAATPALTAAAAPAAFEGWTCDDGTLSASRRTGNLVCHRINNPATHEFRAVADCTKGNRGIGPWRSSGQISSATCPSSGADVTDISYQLR